MPYGLSVPHYFIVSFLVMAPVYALTRDWTIAWSVGVAWNFVHGVIEILGAFIGGFIRKVTPRAAMLGTLAGVALTFIAMRPAMDIWETPYIGLPAFAIVLIGWLAQKPFPGKVPAGLLAVLVGTALGWATGYMKPQPLTAAISGLSLGLPIPGITPIVVGLKLIGPFLAAAIPLAIYAFMESMNNIESTEAAGDKYGTVESMLVPGIGTLIGALFGSPFPTLIYIGHPGWKSVGARIGYSLWTGILILGIGVLGLLPVLLTVIPLVAVLPILVYIGMVMGAQAFNASPRRHAPAIVIALIPWVASYIQNQVDNALGAVGTSAARVGFDTLREAGVAYHGMAVLGSGAILVAMILGAITAYVIDRKFQEATYYSLFAAVSAYFGVIHASRVGFGVGSLPAAGYLMIAIIFYVMGLYKKEENVVQLDPGEAPDPSWTGKASRHHVRGPPSNSVLRGPGPGLVRLDQPVRPDQVRELPPQSDVDGLNFGEPSAFGWDEACHGARIVAVICPGNLVANLKGFTHGVLHYCDPLLYRCIRRRGENGLGLPRFSLGRLTAHEQVAAVRCHKWLQRCVMPARPDGSTQPYG